MKYISKEDREKLEILFDEGAARVDTEPEYWIRGADEGRSYCLKCCEKEVEKLLEKDPGGDYEVAGGNTEGDSTPYCETCKMVLENTFTDYACEEELGHFLQNGCDLKSADDCLSLSKMIGARWWEPYPDRIYRDETEKKIEVEYFEGLHELCRTLLNEMGDKPSLKDLILQKAKEGKVVFMTYDGPLEADLDEFIKQPTQGLLYDLNRGPEVVLSFLDDPKWVNDYAVGLVIGRLKEQVDEAKRTKEDHGQNQD